MTEQLRIGQVAERAGVSTRALRYYEEQGLLEPDRTSGGQRVYPPSAVEQVQLIQELFGAGLSSTLLAELLPAVHAGHVDGELSARLATEQSRLQHEIDALRRASRRLGALLALVDHADTESCPRTLDEAAGEEVRVTRRVPPRGIRATVRR